MTRVVSGERLDRVVAAALVVLGQVELWVGHAIPGPKALTLPLAILITGSVALRRRLPLEVGSVVMLSNATLILAGANGRSVAIALGWMCALYAVAVWTDGRGFVTGLGVLVLANLIAYFGPDSRINDTVLFTVIPGAVLLIVRRAVRDRQLLAEALAARADLLERERELRAHEAVADERALIARELHDLVAHNVSVMVVQAGAERHALPADQASTRAALTAIEQAGRQALSEARRLVGVLRRNGDHGELEPQPTIDQIEFMIEQIERAGLPVTLEVEGERVPLPAGVDLCAYRVVQEGLTNALKHAGAGSVEILLRYAPRGLDVTVRDHGRGPTHPVADEPGHGLIGMRERVALYGGELHTGPHEGGGFEVRAHLPLA